MRLVPPTPLPLTLTLAVVRDPDGMANASSYNYTASTGKTCLLGKDGRNASAGVSNFVKLPANDYASLMQAIATVGPISISVDASWGSYEKGVYQGCSKNKTMIDHAVQLVGYGTEDGLDYWLVRNSWGAKWGEVSCHDTAAIWVAFFLKMAAISSSAGRLHQAAAVRHAQLRRGHLARLRQRLQGRAEGAEGLRRVRHALRLLLPDRRLSRRPLQPNPRAGQAHPTGGHQVLRLPRGRRVWA